MTKKLTHGDFFKYFKDAYPKVVEKMGTKWNTSRWDTRATSFNGRYNHGWELTEFSRRILNMCIELRDCGAYISNETMLKYYKKVKM